MNNIRKTSVALSHGASFKRIMNLIAVSGISLTLAACAGANAATTDTVSNSVETPPIAASSDSSGGNTSETSSPEAEKKTVYGEVTEVIGNSFTLKVIETPQFIGGSFEQPDMGSITIDGKSIQDMIDEAGGEEAFREQMQQRRGDMANGQGGFQPGSVQTGDRQAFSAQPGEGQVFSFQPGDGQVRSFGAANGEGAPAQTRNYTGEEIEVIIPVGIPVTTTSMGQSGATETEVKMEAIKAGNLMLITYADDGETVEKAVLMQSTMRTTRGQFGDANAAGDAVISSITIAGEVPKGAADGPVMFYSIESSDVKP